ncbi:hypothetical protein CI109_100030 [Kwoniella shandongensis]|uniref:DUF1365 domain-containing protein n=1 Tax=Kwoniella shandongensis TaxID=1734106 RepID=A0A5M6BXF2_9TREE|nr:uncharacterized protein CI109_005997 [Kwoniella shandongensis]KAA5525689.1 hypothetical protein CI109_005997 [Kwoniella shandongensis]
MSLVSPSTAVSLLTAGLGIGLTLLLHYRSYVKPPLSSSSNTTDGFLPSFFIPAVTSHGRYLPLTARNSFSYSVLYVGVDIDALESGRLNLPFRVFAYSGHPITKILGLRSNNYLGKGDGRDSLREKLEAFLERSECGIQTHEIRRVWMVTSPSFVGWEGPNPLTTWYCYGKTKDGTGRGPLKCVILEVHNTFGEAHAYVLKADSPLRHEPAAGYDLAFTFPRSFHVSPFNSRDGYYRADIIDPFPPDAPPSHIPQVKILLRLLTPEHTHKLTAVLTSGPSPPIPLEPGSISAILAALAKWPFTLFSVTARTFYQAYILHYKKKLALFPRPEPKIAAEGQEGVFNPPEKDDQRLGIVIGRQKEAWTERKARDVIGLWAQGRAEHVGVGLEVNFGNGRERMVIAPKGDDRHSNGNGHGSSNGHRNGHASLHQQKDIESETLRITTSDPNFFTNLLLSPSPQHSLILFPERLTSVSTTSLFLTLFASPPTPSKDFPARQSASIRSRFFLHLYSYSTLAPTPQIPSLNTYHFSDDPTILDWRTRLQITRLLFWTWFGEMADENLLNMLKGRFVPGQEPWLVWDRGMKRVWGIDPNVPNDGGSVRLDE